MSKTSLPAIPHIAATMAKAICNGKLTVAALREQRAEDPQKFIAMVKGARAKRAVPAPIGDATLEGPAWDQVVLGFSDERPAFSYKIWTAKPTEAEGRTLGTLNIFHARFSNRDYEELCMTTAGICDEDHVDKNLCGCTFRAFGAIGGDPCYGRFSDWMNSEHSPDMMGHWEFLIGKTRWARGNAIIIPGSGVLFWNAYSRGYEKGARQRVAKRIIFSLARFWRVFAHTEMDFQLHSNASSFFYINDKKEHTWVADNLERPLRIELSVKIPERQIPKNDTWGKTKYNCANCNDRIDEDEAYFDDSGEPYCQSCYDNRDERACCEHCGDRVDEEDEVHIAGGTYCRCCVRYDDFLEDDVARHWPVRDAYLLNRDGTYEVHRTKATQSQLDSGNIKHAFRFTDANAVTFGSLKHEAGDEMRIRKVVLLFDDGTYAIRYTKLTIDYTNERYREHLKPEAVIHHE